MIRPRYIICSESRIVDRATGLVTHVNVLDELAVSLGPRKEQPAALPFLKFVTTAVWMRESDEESEEAYVFETYMYVPGEEEARRIHAGEFQFGSSRFYRLDAFVQVGLKLDEASSGNGLRLKPGILRLESRVRRSGDVEWLTQDYLIPVRVDQTAPELAEPPERNHAE